MNIKYLLSVVLTMAAFSGGHFCFAADGETFPYVGIVNAKDVNVRAGQNVNFAQLGQLKQGDKIVVVGKSYRWLEIRLPGYFDVYIHADYLEDMGQNIGKVLGKRVNIRSSGDLEDSMVLGQAREGQLVLIKEKQGDWYRMEPIPQSHGWVSEKLVDFQSAKIPPPSKIETPVRDTIEHEKSRAVSQPLPPSVQSISGVVQLLAPAISSDVRHKIAAQDSAVYYLQGYRSIIDGFLEQKVRIQGVEQRQQKAEHPVIFVHEIRLIL